MDFPHVDERTEERFTRLWPLVAENEKLKEAAKDAPAMLKFNREGGEPHFRLYEARIPNGVDVDARFGSFATDEARQASLAESAEFRSAKRGMDTAKAQNAAELYPENARYYPAMAEGNRERFLETVKGAGFTTKKVGDQPADVSYVQAAEVKAFVSRVGPIPALAEWQSEEAKALWKAEGEQLSRSHGKSMSRAGEAVEASAMRAEGKHFLADNAKGLLMPPVKAEKERAAVVASIGQASVEDLKAVQTVTEGEHRALMRQQYAIQIKAAQAKDPSLTAESFNAKNDKDRRIAANYNELGDGDFTRMVGLQWGKKAIETELKSRGEHLTREEALDKQSKAREPAEKKPSVDEKAKGMKAPAPETGKSGGRAGSRGGAQAAALASTLGRGR